MKIIHVYEHGRLLIDEQGFKRSHWEAFVKLNQIHDNQYFDVLYNGLRFKQFVGVIQIESVLVHIHPKADKNTEDNIWRNVLLEMLKKCGKVKAKDAGTANLKKQHFNLLDVYFNYFLTEIEYLIHSGLVKKYRKETSNVKALKGKLDFAGNIRHNLVHKERFYTTHQVYDTNHQLHQILFQALKVVDTFTRGTSLNDRCKRVNLSYPEVNNIQVNASIINSIQLDRKTAPYERAFDLARFILLNYSPDINGGSNKMIALLFDMNQLWEEYVYVMLRNTINENREKYPNFTIKAQHSKGFWGNNSLQPDIVLTKDAKTYIIDTKWKLPGNSATVEDLRQMYAYARFWDAEKVMLLYPGNKEHSGFKAYKNSDIDGIEHSCKMGFVSVTNESGELNNGIGATVLGMMLVE
jgi:5-methylcytosine-specific restriction enzyme subunit McrC